MEWLLSNKIKETSRLRRRSHLFDLRTKESNSIIMLVNALLSLGSGSTGGEPLRCGL
jgi:hypothetical protein